MNNQVTLGLIGSVLIFSLVGAYLYTDGAEANIPYTDAEAVSQGALIYQSECASCHGADLQGQPNWQARDEQGYLPAPPHDETGHTWHHADALLFQLTKEGVQSIAGGDYKTRMPAFEGKLSDEQIWAVLAYIKAQWPADVAARHTDAFSGK